MENYVSGKGKESKLPPELSGWNWGAFILNWIWGIGNKTYIALLMFVPVVNIFIMIKLGSKGNQWAWQNKEWKSVEHFKKVQKRWAIASAFPFILLWVGFFSLVTTALKGDAFTMSLAAVKSHAEVSEKLGPTLEESFWVLGNVTSNGTTGRADLNYAVSGSKSSADVYVKASKELGEWQLDKVVLVIDGSQERIVVVDQSISSTAGLNEH